MDQLKSGATGPASRKPFAIDEIISNYLGKGLLAKENANMSSLSPAGLLLVIGEEALKQNYLSEMCKAGHGHIANLHELGVVHIHDLGLGVKTPYCSGHSLRNLLHDGIAAGNIISGPAKRLRSAVNHIINHIGACSNEFAGAQAFNDVDLFLGPYALDFFLSRMKNFGMNPEMAMKMTLEEVDQSMQEMIFHLNYNTRYGGQCVDEKTECLTHKGWKRYDELNVGDSIYVVDLETRTVTSDKLTHVNVYDHDGDLLHFSGEGYESVVTEKHRVVYTDSGLTKLYVREAAELESAGGEYYIPKIKRMDTRYAPDIIGEFAVTKVQRKHYKGKVWCPTTSTGTFIARRNVPGHMRKMFITGNSPFSNITLALTVPADMKVERPLVGGKTMEERWGADTFICSCADEHLTYGDIEMWQNIIAEAILKNFLRGDSKGTGFTFPVLTVSVTEEFFKHPLKDLVFELSSKFGNPYFQNFINGHSAGEKINPSDVRSMCCRLSINEKDVRKHIGGLFGNADQTGSLQVVTMNLPMMAVMGSIGNRNAGIQERYDGFMHVVENVMCCIKEEQLWKRQIVEQSFDDGFFSMAKANFKRGFSTFFTTVGFVGLWEAVEFISGEPKSFLIPQYLEMAAKILERIRVVTEGWTAETGKLFNLEATPAEAAAHKLAIKMLKTFPDTPHRGTKEAPYLTNSCHIPVEYQGQVDLLLQTQSVLQPILSGGTVVHLHTGEELDSAGVEAMVRSMCNTPIPFFSVSPVYTKCECCGRLIPGTHEFCPHEHTDEQVADFRKRYPEHVED